jgi:heme a synthase
VDVATVLRIVHGCVAQAFLVTLVALSVRLSLLKNLENRSVLAISNAPSGWVWFALLAVYGQLVLGATMRHLGAGLAIPTFPAANPEGGWMPKTHNLYTDLNFTHTRVGAILVVLIVIFAVWKTWGASPPNSSPRMAAMRTGVLVVLQAVLGVLVVLHHKPKTLATVHVVLGASLLASLAALLVHLISDPSRAESGGIA